jgi:hypothetical protein
LVGWLTNEASHGASGPFIANTHADDFPVRHCSSVVAIAIGLGFFLLRYFEVRMTA